MLYTLDEITLIPSKVTYIESRSECNIFDDNNKLPLFTAPMHCTVFTEESRNAFENVGFNVIVPRTVPFEDRVRIFLNSKWVAFGFDEIKEITQKETLDENKTYYVLIDMANGHMANMISFCKELKENFPNVILMAGNVANPETYDQYALAGIDYIRISVGSGSVCSTTDMTGEYYPMASLISHMNLARNALRFDYDKLPKIVADGGFKNISQIIKALALGADYVMLGEILAKSVEASGDVVYNNGMFRKYFGMSTEEAQKLMNPNKPVKKSEGVTKFVEVSYSIEDWVELFSHGLRSSMSYQNAYDLSEFIGQVNFDYITPKPTKINY